MVATISGKETDIPVLSAGLANPAGNDHYLIKRITRMQMTKSVLRTLIKAAESYTEKGPCKVPGVKGSSNSASLEPMAAGDNKSPGPTSQTKSARKSCGSSGMKTVRPIKGTGKVKKAFGSGWGAKADHFTASLPSKPPAGGLLGKLMGGVAGGGAATARAGGAAKATQGLPKAGPGGLAGAAGAAGASVPPTARAGGAAKTPSALGQQKTPAKPYKPPQAPQQQPFGATANPFGIPGQGGSPEMGSYPSANSQPPAPPQPQPPRGNYYPQNDGNLQRQGRPSATKRDRGRDYFKSGAAQFAIKLAFIKIGPMSETKKINPTEKQRAKDKAEQRLRQTI